MANDSGQDLDAALALFNQGMERQRDAARAEKALKRAEQVKQQAAAHLKAIQDDPGSDATARAEAEAAYRDAVAAFNRRRNGDITDPTESRDTTGAATETEAADQADPADGTGDVAAPAPEPAG